MPKFSIISLVALENGKYGELASAICRLTGEDGGGGIRRDFMRRLNSSNSCCILSDSISRRDRRAKLSSSNQRSYPASRELRRLGTA